MSNLSIPGLEKAGLTAEHFSLIAAGLDLLASSRKRRIRSESSEAIRDILASELAQIESLKNYFLR